jgi:hypothetical protein
MKQELLNDEPRAKVISTAALANVDATPAGQKDANRNPFRENDANSAPFRDEDRPPAEEGTVRPFIATDNKIRSVNQRPDGNESRMTEANGNPAPVTTATTDEDATPLFSERESKDFFGRWDALQVSFIDEPRRAVEQADSLVAGAMKRLAEIFAEERARLESQWDRGDNVSTEDLRVAMRRYRSFFRRLLSV